MRLVPNDDVIETFSPDGADHPLDIPVLPWRSRCNGAIADAHRPKAAREYLAIGSVIIADEILRRCVPWKGFGDLASKPFRRRMGRNTDPHNFSSANSEYDESEQAFEGQCWDDKKVYRCNSMRMITQERLPALRRRSSSSQHVLRDGRLRDREAQFQQFTMDTWRTPERVFSTHPMDEIPQFAINLWPAAPITGLPTPPGPKPRPVPANYGLRPDNGDRTCDTRKEPA